MNSDAANTGTIPLDSDLIKRAQQGDSDAFAALFHAHKSRVYSLCLRMTNNTAEAEDLTQDAFMQVFRKLATFRGDSALSTWLYRIAVNTVLMHFRKKSLCQVSLDAPCKVDNGAHDIRREYGTWTIAWPAASTASPWLMPSENCRGGIAQSFCYTKSRAMSTRKSQKSSVVRSAIRSRNCTKPNCESASCCCVRKKFAPS